MLKIHLFSIFTIKTQRALAVLTLLNMKTLTNVLAGLTKYQFYDRLGWSVATMSDRWVFFTFFRHTDHQKWTSVPTGM